MAIENDEDNITDDNDIEKGLPDTTETDESESRFPLPSSSERIESLDQGDREEVDTAEETYELEKEQEQRPDETKKSSVPERKVKVRKSSSRTTFDPVSKFQNELKMQMHRTKNIEDKVNAIQKRLAQINKTIYSNMKVHGVVRKIQVQLNILQKALGKLDRSKANLNLKSRLKMKVGRKKPIAPKKVKKKTTKKKTTKKA